ncbi:stage II sporulation protein R [Evansella cellulosilytica]|uniref:Stage II sporulation protein R n=1 Tax=Evansella cellulosilytica (strain ATCC 21833 / DSM 2522 / FERM P-1141 / JCM 9156 / N-4) TaxID=649639 RepID=E6TXC6_EVAC2|nr:stage II sporulation protein R [Evansella cellulosilytica]ADU32321.1 stage II sporulation protein R [Evansella cellulosilytica DSM 2522]
MNRKARIYTLIGLIILVLSWEAHVIMPAQAGEENYIADESIRLRILANSNSAVDQQVKQDIRDEVNAHITELVEVFDDVEHAREVINENIDGLNHIVESKLAEVGSNNSFNISLQKTNFPTKLYGSRVYPAGEYEAVLIEIGDGQGDNWWCVLFPPLCFLDFNNGDAVAHEAEEKEEAVEKEEQEQEEIEEDDEDEVKVSFFIVDVFTSLWDRITG